MPLPTREELSAALAELDPPDGDADSVAARLRARGIKGEPMNCHSCPVANYLIGRFGVPREDLTVDTDEVSLAVPFASGLWPRHEIRIPLAVRYFIDRFDNGDYDDLVA